MDLGVLTIPQDSEQFLADVSVAEEQGFDLVGVADSQCLMQELHTSMGAAAHHTDEIEIASSVTNPVTRHPVVTASALCTLNEHSDGRAVLGLSSGDSAVYTLGKSAASLRELKEFIDLFHDLCRGETVEYDGYESRLTWIRRKDAVHEVPIFLAAEGPKTLRMAGEVADRVLIGGGTTPDVVEEAVRRIDAGAEAAGRDPDEIEKWVFARGAVVEDRQTVEETLKSTVAGAAHHTFQFTLEGKQVPEELENDINELVREYDSEQHIGLGDDPTNRRLIDRLGLTEYLIERFAMVGSPGEVVQQIDDIRALDGVDGIHYNPVHDTTTFTERMGEEVMPSL